MHGFSAESFHRRVNNIENIMIIITDVNNEIMMNYENNDNDYDYNYDVETN